MLAPNRNGHHPQGGQQAPGLFCFYPERSCPRVSPQLRASVWIQGLPTIIVALATFAVSPYMVGKLGQTISSFAEKVKDKVQS